MQKKCPSALEAQGIVGFYVTATYGGKMCKYPPNMAETSANKGETNGKPNNKSLSR